MTATNHMMTGAVVAIGLQQPLLVLPLAFLSHFVLDMVPHFGVNEHSVVIRNKHPLFRLMLVIDIALAISMLAILPLVLKHAISWWVLLLGMLAAWVPDAIWISHFRHYLRGNHDHKKGWFARFHQKIQWFERPPGLVVELAWFGMMTVFIGLLVKS